MTTGSSAGTYRLREGVSRQGSLLVSLRPLSVTRLNDAALETVDRLGSESFRSPAAVAAETGMDAGDVAVLFDRLRQRGFLQWAPARDPDHLPPVSIVVTVRNAEDELPACLDALAELSYPDYEVVVVDDGSTDGTVRAARSHPLADGERLRVVEVGSPSEPIGIGASRNRGVDAARHDVVAFTDADCRPRPDWLSDLVPCLSAHDVVGGRVRPHGSAPADAYEGVNSSLDMGSSAARVDPDGATPYLPTANLLARRAVLGAVRFPERNVAEDVAFCWEALERGFDVVYSPRGVVEHDYRDDLRSFAERRADYAASEALLARTYRHGDRVPLSVGALLVAIAVLAVALANGPVLAAGAVGGLVVAAGNAAGTLARYRRLRSTVSTGALLRSRVREALSRSYAVASEVTRYYSLPLALLFAAVVLAGATTAGLAGFAALLAALALPAAVEYALERPPISPAGYAVFYLADHLGYQYGAYRGAFAHRTVAHLAPWERFRPVGALAGIVVSARR